MAKVHLPAAICTAEGCLVQGHAKWEWLTVVALPTVKPKCCVQPYAKIQPFKYDRQGASENVMDSG
jgi:hypothetical protein